MLRSCEGGGVELWGTGMDWLVGVSEGRVGMIWGLAKGRGRI